MAGIREISFSLVWLTSAQCPDKGCTWKPKDRQMVFSGRILNRWRALRQRLALLPEGKRRARLRRRARIFRKWLSPLWAGWRLVLMIIQADIEVREYRQGFRLVWRSKSRSKTKPAEDRSRDS